VKERNKVETVGSACLEVSRDLVDALKRREDSVVGGRECLRISERERRRNSKFLGTENVHCKAS